MSTAYAPEEWKDLFVAIAGASAALAGLLFVAVSINVERILKYEGLPERGLETLTMLLVALVVSIAGLMPGQSHVALGLELLAIAAVLVAVLLRLPIAHRAARRDRDAASWRPQPPGRSASAAPCCSAIGALAELFAVAGGLYWIAAGDRLPHPRRRRQRLGAAGRDPALSARAAVRSLTPGAPPRLRE